MCYGVGAGVVSLGEPLCRRAAFRFDSVGEGGHAGQFEHVPGVFLPVQFRRDTDRARHTEHHVVPAGQRAFADGPGRLAQSMPAQDYVSRSTGADAHVGVRVVLHARDVGFGVRRAEGSRLSVHAGGRA